MADEEPVPVVVLELRAAILDPDPGITEHVKWNARTLGAGVMTAR